MQPTQTSGTFQDLPQNSRTFLDFPGLEQDMKNSRTFQNFQDLYEFSPKDSSRGFNKTSFRACTYVQPSLCLSKYNRQAWLMTMPLTSTNYIHLRVVNSWQILHTNNYTLLHQLQKLSTLSIFHISINIPHFYKYITVMLLDYMNHLITTQVFSTPPKQLSVAQLNIMTWLGWVIRLSATLQPWRLWTWKAD